MKVNIEQLLQEKEICVCVGPGGVGKTSISAAIALGAARVGRKTLVITIDPAKRLADALGIKTLGNQPQHVDSFRAGELWAMMLDPKQTFDELIGELSDSESSREETLSNTVYQQISSGVSGSQEFTAIEKLYELHSSGDFDLIVLDTPPSRDAIDFLDAPDRLSAFFSSRALTLLNRGDGIGARLVGGSAALAFSALKRVIGRDFFNSLIGFFSSVSGISSKFARRSEQVKALLRAPQTALVLVTTAEYHPVRESISLIDDLSKRELHLTAAVINQIHPKITGRRKLDEMERELSKTTDPVLSKKLLATLHDYHALARRDREGVKKLRAAIDGLPHVEIPYLEDENDELSGIAKLEAGLRGLSL